MGIAEFFTTIWEFINQGIFDILRDFAVWGLAKLTVWWFQAKLQSIQVAFGICQSVIADLNLSGMIASAFAGVDSKYMTLVTYARMPEAINLVSSAALTRWVLSIVGI